MQSVLANVSLQLLNINFCIKSSSFNIFPHVFFNNIILINVILYQ